MLFRCSHSAKLGSWHFFFFFVLFSGYLNSLVARRSGKLLVLEVTGHFWVAGSAAGAVAGVLSATGIGCLILPAGFG